LDLFLKCCIKERQIFLREENAISSEQTSKADTFMTNDPESFFVDHFVRLTRTAPYPWQKKLFLNFIGPLWPEVVDLPTGAGKTTVLYIWLLALAWSIRAKTFGVPRRLAWIVNRRVVVDQVTTELEKLLEVIKEGGAEVLELRGLLASYSLTNSALGVSTLRGQFADNGDWSRDPSTPAVVVGTVDMIGSRLMFRGYRAGPYYRPMHAGLLGVDTLIVNDEAHLSPALARLLTMVRDRGPAGQIPGKCFRILLLSATPGAADGLLRFEHDPAEDAAENSHFRKVFQAPKSLSLREVANLNELDAAVWTIATDSPATRTAVFIEQPEKAARLAERLRKEKKPCALLTGTMRGYERDRLTDDPVFKRFLEPEVGSEPVWLVCTSAGEVGVNFSCERMISGLAEADHLLQRFGRLNRFGDSSPGEAYLVFRKPSEKENKLRDTLTYLRGLEGDVSCSRVWGNRAPAEACTDPPILALLEDRHVDLWAQTTYHDRFVPPVASWLHGKQESEAPDAEVVWRSDVGLLTEWGIDPDQIQSVLEYFPVQAQEKLSEPASRVAKKLEEIQERIGAAEASKTLVIVVESDGKPSICRLAYLVAQTRKKQDYLGYKMLLLPDRLGSVPLGMFHSAASGEDAETLDVAEVATNPKRVRFLFKGDESAARLPTKEARANSPVPNSRSRDVLAAFASDGGYKPALVIEHPTDDDACLVYFGAHSSKRSGIPREVSLPVHQANVAAEAKKLVSLVGLPSLEDTYEKAGNIHDSGKNRRVWQLAMGGTLENPIAKTKAPANLRLIDGYRHELGSLLDAVGQADGSFDDLVLHLVASHHAAGRPFFKIRQYDPESLKRSARESVETARRYARLQTRYGAWGLAYLEALFKCADGIVSGREGDAASA
jgi:CRISPR-associated endonuclease/helicase Cas3